MCVTVLGLDTLDAPVKEVEFLFLLYLPAIVGVVIIFVLHIIFWSLCLFNMNDLTLFFIIVHNFLTKTWITNGESASLTL